MSWSKLNNHELQAMRKLLMLDVSEAAQWIGKVSNRTWQYWEAGRNKVPDDVDMEMYALIQQRNELIEELGDQNTLPYYHAFEDYQAAYPDHNPMQWRLHQSAVSFLFSLGGDIQLT